MFGFRTPAKQAENNAEQKQSPNKAEPQTSNVRRSIGEWEAAKTDAPIVSTQTVKVTQPAPAKTRQRLPLSQDSKTSSRRASTEAIPSPPKQPKYIDRTSEARACLTKAKLHLNNSRNLKTDIKTEVTQAIERLYNLVKELEEEKKGKAGNEAGKTGAVQIGEAAGKNDLMTKMEEHNKLLLESCKKLDDLKVTIEEQKGNLERMTYADIAATRQEKGPPERNTLHSIVITSEQETDSGEVVLNRVREAMDAKEGWVQVTRVRKARDRKIVMSCATKDERNKIKDKLEKAGKHLVVEEVKNRDPLVILKDVLLINSDEDILRAIRNQNRAVFRGLDDEENRLEIKYKRRARNPHTCHVVASVSPKIWKRVVDLGALYIDLQRIKVADQSPLVQCSRCLGYGHTKRFCKEAVDLCSHCGGPHLRTDCAEWLAGAAPACRNCTKAEMGCTNHNAFNQECPIRKRWDTLARSTVAYC